MKIMASRIKSSSGDVEIESTGSGIKFLSSGTEIGSITSGGLLSATTIDATKLTGAIPTTYTKTEVDTADALKANQSTTYTKTEVDTALNGKLTPTGDGSQLTGIESGGGGGIASFLKFS
jgi:succinyl-CoA synthetase beta subunit